MNREAEVGLVVSHTERAGRDDGLKSVGAQRILDPRTLDLAPFPGQLPGRPPASDEPFRVLTTALVRGGEVVAGTGNATLAAARELVASGLHSLPWEGLTLAHGDPAIPTVQIV